RAGGLAALLAPHELDDAAADRVIASIDGLVLSGGLDVDPARYGQDRHPTVAVTSEIQDRFETALLRAALRAGRPVLCICRGLQVLNVAFGGTLHQHLGDLDGAGPHGIPF